MSGLADLGVFLIFSLLVVVVLTPTVAFLVRWRYGAAVRRLMSAGNSARPVTPGGAEGPLSETPAHALKIDFRAPPQQLIPSKALLRLGLGYLLAGVCYALTSAVVLLLLNGIELSPLRILVLGMVFSTLAVFSAFYAAGVRFLLIILAVLLWSLIVLGFAELVSPPGNPVIGIFYLVAIPLSIGLLVMNRKVGTIAPLFVLPSMLIGVGIWTAISLALGIDPLSDMSFMIWVLPLLGLLLSLFPAWLCLALMAWQYGKGRVSELMLQNDVLWLITSVSLAHPYIPTLSWKALAVFAPLIIYRLVLALFFRLSRPSGDPIRLLFLRVFGFQTRQGELHRVVLNAWRQQGPVALIGAPDSALDTLDPPELFAFVTGRLKTLFISDATVVQRELARPQTRASDGLYKVDDFYCFADTWQPSVQTLIDASERVVMDLRGFSAQNMGCIFEIEQLLQRCELAQLVFLADSATDQAFLSQTLTSAWARTRSEEPASLTVWLIDNADALRGLAHQLETRPER